VRAAAERAIRPDRSNDTGDRIMGRMAHGTRPLQLPAAEDVEAAIRRRRAEIVALRKILDAHRALASAECERTAPLRREALTRVLTGPPAPPAT
jgi:hypothetical protein